MSLTNIKSKSQSERGFTIVELLIVVVVIAILAAITIVSYNGITNRANASSAKSTASTWQKIELYQAEVGQYPYALSSLTTAASDKAYKVETSIPLVASGLSATNGKNTVIVEPCNGTGTAPTNQATTTGNRITYWTYETPTTQTISIGQTTTCAAGWTQ